MIFNVDFDHRNQIQGFVLPDIYTESPRIVVTNGTNEVARLVCNKKINGVFPETRHKDAVVGFEITEDIVPGLSSMPIIEIFHEQTGILIYRRFWPTKHKLRRAFRLETHFITDTKLDKSLMQFFQYTADRIEQYGVETSHQMFQLTCQPSVYITGNVLAKNYLHYLPLNMTSFVSLRDPYYELAIRISVLAHPKLQIINLLSARDKVLWAPAMAYFEGTELGNAQKLIRKIKNTPPDVLKLFTSPFTGQLTMKTPSDKIGFQSVGAALNTLSEFSFFYFEDDATNNAHDIAELLEVPAHCVEVRGKHALFSEIAETLSSLSLLESLLEHDLILNNFVRQSLVRAHVGSNSEIQSL